MKKVVVVLVMSFIVFTILPFAHGQGAFEGIPYVKNPDAEGAQKLIAGTARPLETVEQETQALIDAAHAMIEVVNQSGLQVAADELAKGADGEFGEYILPGSILYAIHEVVDVTEESDLKSIKNIGATLPEYAGTEWPDFYQFPDLAGFLYIAAMNEAMRTQQATEVLAEYVWADPAWADNAACRLLTYRTDFSYQGKSYSVWNSMWLDE